MLTFDRLSDATDWLDVEFVERERTPRPAIKIGIQLHLAGLSLSNTKQHLETLGVQRSRTAIHDWVQKADLQPATETTPNHVAVNETVIQVNDQRRWLYAAVDPDTNEILHARLFPTTNVGSTIVFLRELRQKHDLSEATILVDHAQHLTTALAQLGLRFRTRRHGNRNSVERHRSRIRLATPIQRRSNRGCKPWPSGGTDAKVNTTDDWTECPEDDLGL